MFDDPVELGLILVGFSMIVELAEILLVVWLAFVIKFKSVGFVILLDHLLYYFVIVVFVYVLWYMVVKHSLLH